MDAFISPVFVATTLSTIASITACTYFLGVLRARRAQSGFIERSTTITVALVALPISWFLGYVVGGNFGGSIASRLAFLSERTAIPIGIAMGIFVVTTFLSCGLSLIGLGVGVLLQRAFGGRSRVKE
jgi:hypothetical protein